MGRLWAATVMVKLVVLATFGLLGAVLAHLGLVLGRLGPVLGHLGAAFGHPSCNTKAQSEKPKGAAGVASASESGRAPVPTGTGSLPF